MDTEVKQLHYKRQFLAPEQSRYDQSMCQSQVELCEYRDDPPPLILAELLISDGHNVCSFEVHVHDTENYDEHLAVITALMEQVIAYRQSYAEALAIVRKTAITGGADASTVLNIDTLKLNGVP